MQLSDTERESQESDFNQLRVEEGLSDAYQEFLDRYNAEIDLINQALDEHPDINLLDVLKSSLPVVAAQMASMFVALAYLEGRIVEVKEENQRLLAMLDNAAEKGYQ